MGTDKVIFVEERWGATGSDTVRMLDQKWRHRKSRDFSHYFFPHTLFLPYFFSHIFSPILFFPVPFFSLLFLVLFFTLIFLPRIFPPYFFSRTFSKVATFEMERLKISVSCFFSTCRYNTVHVPCGISVQTSPVGLPLDGWGARMRDLKGPKMNLLKANEDWNVL